MGTQATIIAEFLNWVAEVRKDFNFPDDDPMQPWFRGQRDGLKLLPRLYRENLYGDARRRKDKKLEDEIIEEFIVRTPTLSEGISLPTDDWGWLFLMQHFGAPTRLLDWTEGALLALYFAVNGDPGYYDAVVWALDPYELNRKVIGKEWIIPPCAPGVTEDDKKLVQPWLPSRFRSLKPLPKNPVAVLPSHTARRISAQRSCFTVHGEGIQGLEELGRNGLHFLTKFVVRSSRVHSARKELLASGIDESTIFPGLDGLGKSLHLKWLVDPTTLPHDGVYTRLKPSNIHGVGVFAIRNIKKDTPIFEGDNEEMLWVDKDRLRHPKLPKEIHRLYKDFPVIKEHQFGCPQSFNRLTMSWYINEPREGERPNVYCDPATYDFFAAEDIHKGDELTVDYNTYSERPNVDGVKDGKPMRRA